MTLEALGPDEAEIPLVYIVFEDYSERQAVPIFAHEIKALVAALTEASTWLAGDQTLADLLTQDTHTIQHTLADRYRATTGQPRGQLWQPCELAGCDNEPVCLNCLMCEEHCHCFD